MGRNEQKPRRVYVPEGRSSEDLPCRSGEVLQETPTGAFVLHDDGHIFGWSDNEIVSLVTRTNKEKRSARWTRIRHTRKRALEKKRFVTRTRA